jgi:phenylalanyl-tRNA synthetase beta chain
LIISWNWLNRYCDLSGLDPVEAAHRFTITTAEIEEIISPPTEEFLGQFIVAEVRSVEAHPNADKLRCCKVFDGEQELSIVCGAANVREGLLTVLAPIGCSIGDMKIKKSKLRGEVSEGMLCSEKELSTGPGDEGIVELEGFVAGQRVNEVYSDLGVTWDLDNKAITHRPDLWGHHGLSREAAAVFRRPLQALPLADLATDLGTAGYEVSIEDGDLCRRYCGLALSGIEVKPSPLWMQQLLKDVGQEPRNNVVDATNFVMLELGQPTHAFDVTKLSSQKITVTSARGSEPFTALTGKSVELNAEDLVIRSGEDVVALAGVVGGENSSISESTTEVFLEAAHFAPLAVRRTAKRHDLRTDASARFEKSLDPENAELAIRRLVELLKETCPGLKLKSSLIDVYPNPIPALIIELSPGQVEKKMGFAIDGAEQKEILERLDFVVSGTDPLMVTVPSFRNTKDIEESIDLIEEIGRVAGYDRIIPQSPRLSLESKPSSLGRDRARLLQDTLVSRGYDEVKTYSFASLPEMERLNLATDKAMALANPMSREQTHMRTQLLTRQVGVWQSNAKHLDEFQMFELGVVFEKSEVLLPHERQELCVSSYGDSDQGEGFYGLKDDVLAMFESMGLLGVKVVTSDGDRDGAHPMRCASLLLDGQEIGYVAELHPSLASTLQLKKRVNFAVVKAPLTLPEPEQSKFVGLDRFPAVSFSLSLLVPNRTTIGEVLDSLQISGGEVVQDLVWLGNYEGTSTPEGQLSMTVSMNFRLPDRTMIGDEIQALQDILVKAAKEKGYHLRKI